MRFFAPLLIGFLFLTASLPAADFNGDGTSDIAVFRDGLWLVRGVTRVYFGAAGDRPVPGDFTGELKDRVAVFRPAAGLWIVRGTTRVYFGSGSDSPQVGDYDGDGTEEIGIFRPAAGLWIARGVTRFYFGGTNDEALSPGKAVPARGEIPVTGQTSSYQVGDDGYYRAGSGFCFQTFINGCHQITLDRNTGLMWASDGNSMGCCYGAQTDWNAAIDWCYNISFGDYSDWRLPNAKELESISDYGESYPAVEEAWFPNTKKERYWASTSYSNVHPEFAFAIDVRYSSFDWGNKLTDTFCLRAVRGPDPGSGSGKSSGLRPGSRGADFDGNETGNPAIFRPASGLWAVRGLTRIYFGGAGDTAVPGNYDGGGGDRAAVFRPASGLWAVRGLTHFYYGTSADQAVPGDLLGQRRDLAGIFRPGNNLWSFRGLTRFYYGTAGDQALPPGRIGGPRRCLLPVTGQTATYRTGDDGYYEAGAPFDFDLLDISGAKITVDNHTGLIWAADGDQAGCCFGAQTDWASAVAWCQNLSFAGNSNWRLANARELQTIADYGRTYPSIDTAYFPNAKQDWYWSSTTMKGHTTDAFIMQFDIGGYLDNDAKTLKHYVRAVTGP